MPTVIQISDTHLSGKHGYFHANWRRAVAHVNRLRPDLVVNTGNLSVNGAGDAAELDFAREEHERVESKLRVLPGNHDIGEEPAAAHLGQVIDAGRRERYRARFGEDWWAETLGRWRLIGLDSLLFDSGLEADAEQRAWLTAELRAATGPVGIFLHKPLFLDDPFAPGDLYTVLPGARAELLGLLRASKVRFVASGHLHQHRAGWWEDIELIWAPSTAFITNTSFNATERILGAVRIDLDGPDYRWMLESIPGMELHDLDVIRGQGEHAYLFETPPCPPDLAFEP